MSLKKKLLMVLLVLLLLTSVVAGMLWHRDHYTMVDFRFYPKDARNLDLRGKSISVRHYEKLLRRMPGVDVIWDVPLSAGSYPSNVKEIAITGLEAKDIEKMDYLTRLELVKADGLLPFGITVDLLHGCIPLFRRLCLELVFREIFQFQNVAVLHLRISLQVRHEEHVAETVVQLHFGHGQVIGIDTQVGGEETLNVPFALYAAASWIRNSSLKNRSAYRPLDEC